MEDFFRKFVRRGLSTIHREGKHETRHLVLNRYPRFTHDKGAFPPRKPPKSWVSR